MAARATDYSRFDAIAADQSGDSDDDYTSAEQQRKDQGRARVLIAQHEAVSAFRPSQFFCLWT